AISLSSQGPAAASIAWDSRHAGLPEGLLAGARRHPGETKTSPRFEPRTLAAAWALGPASADWKRKVKAISQEQQTNVAERFLAMPIAPGEAMTFGQMPFGGIRRSHVKAILGRYERPHAAAAALALLRKLCGAALDADWIENDPTHRIKFRP